MPTLQTLKRLLRDTGGTSMIEFAIIAPAFLAIIFAIFQIAMVYLAQGGLESGAERAGRLLMTGQAQQGSWSASALKTEACKALPPYLKCANVMLDVNTVTSYAGATTTIPDIHYDSNGNPDNLAYRPGGRGEIVVVRMMYLWPLSPVPLGFNLANQSGNGRLMIATSVLKTEFY